MMSSNRADTSRDAWSPSLYNSNASFVYSPAFTLEILHLLGAKQGEKILDVGCGTGELTKELEKVVGSQGIVVGFDHSDSMVQKAKANGLTHTFVCDAQALVLPSEFSSLEGRFDAVFSNAALHWCKRNPVAVIEGVKRALRKGGRFVAEFGGHMNCVGIRMTLRNVLAQRGYDASSLDPWYFPSVEEYQELLRQHGFKVEQMSLVPRITPLNGSLIDWMRTFCRHSWLDRLDDEEAEEIMAEVQRICATDCFDGYRWCIMYVRLRFVAKLA